MKRKLFVLMVSLAFVLVLVGCRKTPSATEPTDKPTNSEEYVETNLDDGKARVPYALKVYDNGNNIVYFGEKFTGEGYVIKFVYQEVDNIGTDLPLFSAVTLTDFNIDDSKVDYRKEGRYVVRITARVRADVLNTNILVDVKADKYEYLGVKHLYGLSCDEFVNFALGQDVSTIIPSELYAVYTENKYENDELVTISEKIRSGYKLDTSSVNTNVAGSYPVYVTYSETYGDLTLTVSTFFILVVA